MIFSVPAVLRERNFLIYSIGNAISWLGTWSQRIGVGWLSWDLTHRAVWVGIISLAQLLPLIVFGPLFGALLDRHDHRRYALGVNIALALLAVLLYVLTATHLMGIAILCVLAVLLGIANGAYQAVRLAIINDLVAPVNLPSAIAASSVVFNLARALGPAMAGIIIARDGVAAAFAVNAVSFLAILAALGVIKLRPVPRKISTQGVLADTREGLRYVLAHAGIRQMLLLSAITSILGRGIIELLPAFADAVFHRGSVGLANLTTAAGVGAIVGALLRARTGDVGAQLTRYSTLLLGAVVIGFGSCGPFSLGIAITGLFGFVIVLCSVGLQVILQSSIHDHFRGRVLGLWSAVNQAGPGIGAALSGLLAQWVGLKPVTIINGVLCLGLVVWAMPPGRPLLLERVESVANAPTRTASGARGTTPQ